MFKLPKKIGIMSILLAATTLGLLLCHAHATAEDFILTNRATELHATADDNSPVLQKLAEKTAVVQLQRTGAWSKVKSGPVIGWVRMMHLRGGAVVVQSEPAEGGLFSGAAKLFGSAKSTRNAQNATLGIRGLSKEDLQLAEPDAAALEKMQSFKAKKSDGDRFAKEAQLAVSSLDYNEFEINVALSAKKK